MVTDGVIGASWLPTDGYLDPSQLTYALADGARRGGCRAHQHPRHRIDVERGAVTGVRTEHGDIECEIVVNAAGMFAAEIGRLAGVRVPIIPMAHEYVVTQPFRERDGHMATMRDPDHLIYFREEGGGLVWGGYERESAPWALRDGGRGLDDIPPDFNGRLLEEDWDRFEEVVDNARMRVPAMETSRITRLINGPEAFTPDGEFCLGETEVRGLFVAAGFCAHGLAGAGGIGKVMAEWIAGGEPELDLWQMDVRRFGAHYRSPSYTVKRVREVYETYYDIKYPNHERTAGRPLRVSPVYDWHRAHGAVFGEKSGWERVNWYGANEAAGDESLRPRGWAGMHWSPAIGAEHAACRDGAVLFDETSFAKIEVSGPGRRRDARAPVRQPRGPRGRPDHLHADAQLARRHRVRLHGVAAGRGPLRDRHRHRVRPPRPGLDPPPRGGRRARRGRHVALGVPRAVGPAGARRAGRRLHRRPVVRLHALARAGGRRRPGPGAAGHLRRRARLGAVLPDGVRRRAVGGALGGGEPYGLVAGGYRAIDSLRLEKGYRVWGADITPDDTPYEGGLGFSVRADKDFLGRDALDEHARPPAVLPGARRSALGRARQRARAGGRRDRRPRHLRRLRLHRGALDRLRVPAGRARRGRDRDRRRDLRRVGRRRGRHRAAVGSQGSGIR